MSFCIKNDILHLRRSITLLKQEFEQKITLLQAELNDITGVTNSTFTDTTGLILDFENKQGINGKYELQEKTQDAIFMVTTKEITQTGENKKSIYLHEDKKSIMIIGNDTKWYVIQFQDSYDISSFEISDTFEISSETAVLSASIFSPVNTDSITSF